VSLLRAAARQPGIRQVRVASGIRADLAERDALALEAYTGEFTGGQLKLAPEHSAPDVLERMRKPPLRVFEKFLENFIRQSRAAGREQYVVPYLMSAFPGCTDDDMRALASWLRQRHWSPQQTQCFIPTPGTIATAMFYSGKDETGRDIYVEELQRQLDIAAHYGLIPQKQIPVSFQEYDIVIDALFGNGLNREINGMAKKVIEAVNRSGLPIVSVDIPSGIDASSGKVLGCAIKATVTVTFGFYKKGQML